jgi:hypothetical protein
MTPFSALESGSSKAGIHFPRSIKDKRLGPRAVSGIVDGVDDFFSEGGMSVIVTGPTENLETFSLGGRFVLL